MTWRSPRRQVLVGGGSPTARLVPPSAPTLHLTASTSSTITLQWGVSSDGGAPVLGATLSYNVSGEHRNEPVTGASHVVTGLLCGTAYTFTVTARNRIGWSPPSREVEARTKGQAPSAPPQFQLVTSNSSHASLYLSQWRDGGCSIQYYTIQYRVEHGQRWNSVGGRVPPTRLYSLGGLEPGTSYSLRVTAHSSAGSTTALYSLTTTGAGGGSDGQVLSSSVSNKGSNKRAALTWAEVRAVALPVVVSVSAAVLVLATACICLYSRRAAASKGAPSPPCGSPSQVSHKEQLAREEALDQLPCKGGGLEESQPHLQQQYADLGPLSNSEVYHYATTTLPVGQFSSPLQHHDMQDQHHNYNHQNHNLQELQQPDAKGELQYASTRLEQHQYHEKQQPLQRLQLSHAQQQHHQQQQQQQHRAPLSSIDHRFSLHQQQQNPRHNDPHTRHQQQLQHDQPEEQQQELLRCHQQLAAVPSYGARFSLDESGSPDEGYTALVYEATSAGREVQADKEWPDESYGELRSSLSQLAPQYDISKSRTRFQKHQQPQKQRARDRQHQRDGVSAEFCVEGDGEPRLSNVHHHQKKLKGKMPPKRVDDAAANNCLVLDQSQVDFQHMPLNKRQRTLSRQKSVTAKC